MVDPYLSDPGFDRIEGARQSTRPRLPALRVKKPGRTGLSNTTHRGSRYIADMWRDGFWWQRGVGAVQQHTKGRDMGGVCVMHVGSSVNEELHNYCLLLFVVVCCGIFVPCTVTLGFWNIRLGPLPMSTDSSSYRRECTTLLYRCSMNEVYSIVIPAVLVFFP